jgi:hypothetical protein
MTSGYVWILPALIAAGWILSWWGSRRIRWGLLFVAVVISVLCVAFGFHTYGGTPSVPEDLRTHGVTFSSDDLRCSPFFECMDRYPVYWMMTGLIGSVCCVALTLVTSVVDIITWFNRRGSALND